MVSNSLYCVHGRYVGDPYGPDFLCFNCEEGNLWLYEGEKYQVYIVDKEGNEHLLNGIVFYSEDKAKEHVQDLNKIVKDNTAYFIFKCSVFKFWSKPEDMDGEEGIYYRDLQEEYEV